MITHFRGEHFFLSNFFPISVLYDELIYPSSEHAYVAAKTTDKELRKFIQKIKTAGQAKKFGGSEEFPLRTDWNSVKVDEMRRILEMKFSRFRSDFPIWSWLESTSPHELVEVNSWDDTFWGQCPLGNGKNMLGKLLMELRDDITARFT